jgi:CheY-like chemotaxis protein
MKQSDNLEVANILLVEDCDDDVMFLRDFFEKERIGNRVTRVRDYESAWRHIESGAKFDLLVVDIRIPGNGGLELIERVRAVPGYQDVRVIIMSGVDTPKDAKEVPKEAQTAAGLKVLVYMVKPVSREKWEAAVEELRLHKAYMVMKRAA